LSAFSFAFSNGLVSLLTTRVENKALAAYVSEQSSASANLQMTTASLEVLACIAFKQPISQAEIDHLFDVDKRGVV
jgi:chromosome segregation and condensation protein ScpB